MKTVIFITVGLVLGIFLLSGFWGCQRASAHGDENGAFPRHKVDWVKKELTGKLELTDIQVAELDRIIETVKAKHADLHAAYPDLRSALFDELRKDQLTAEEVRQLFESRRPALEEMLTVISEGIADFHAVLSPEQREKLVAEMESHNERCRFRRHW